VIGGAYFKFIPADLRDPGAGPITDLDDSPLAAGSVSGLRLGHRSGATDYGQGTQNGLGSWVPVPQTADTDLRAQAEALRLTGFYRPEDIDIDRHALADGRVEFCGNNTGNEPDDQYFGEVVCIIDGTVAESAANTAATGSSTRTARPSPTCSVPTTTTCGPASPTGATRTCWVTAASASRPSTTSKRSGPAGNPPSRRRARLQTATDSASAAVSERGTSRTLVVNR
jgi:hypothetical protein